MTRMKNVWVLNDNASKKPLWCCRGSHKASPPQLSTVTPIEPCRSLIRDNCAVIIHGTSQFLSGVQWHTFEIPICVHLKRPQVALLLLFLNYFSFFRQPCLLQRQLFSFSLIVENIILPKIGNTQTIWSLPDFSVVYCITFYSVNNIL